MFGPRDPIPPATKKAVTHRYVYEGGKHYIVVSFGGGSDDWIRIEINRRQVAGFIEDAMPRVLNK